MKGWDEIFFFLIILKLSLHIMEDYYSSNTGNNIVVKICMTIIVKVRQTHINQSQFLP